MSTNNVIQLAAHRPGNVVPLRPRTVGYDPFAREGLLRLRRFVDDLLALDAALSRIAGEQAADAGDGGKPADSE